MFDIEVKADKGYLNGQRKEKCGGDMAGKVTVFRFLTPNGKIYIVAAFNTQIFI
ncbi:hypothetical protein ACKLNO_01670 [Neisseriaceae bacterium B1]